MPDLAMVCRHKVPASSGPGGERLLRWCGNAAQPTAVGPRCLQHSPPGKEPHPHGQRTRAIIEANKLTLSRDERHQLAEFLTGHKGSWSTLNEKDARRIADSLHGFLVIQALLLMRGM